MLAAMPRALARPLGLPRGGSFVWPLCWTTTIIVGSQTFAPALQVPAQWRKSQRI